MVQDEEFCKEAMLLLEILSEQYGAEPFSQGDATRDYAKVIGQKTVEAHLGYLMKQGYVRKFGGTSRLYEIVRSTSVEDKIESDIPADLTEIYRD